MMVSFEPTVPRLIPATREELEAEGYEVVASDGTPIYPLPLRKLNPDYKPIPYYQKLSMVCFYDEYEDIA
jgi:hypothetical protein